MDRVYHAMQSMTGTLEGQPQTSMISHLVNVCFGYTQLEGLWRAATLAGGQSLSYKVKCQVEQTNETWSGTSSGFCDVFCRIKARFLFEK